MTLRTLHPDTLRLQLALDRVVGKPRKFTDGTETWQKAMRGGSRSALRISDAVSDGLRDYRQRSDASSRAARDGELRDLPRNLAHALGISLERVSRAPYDFWKRIDTAPAYKRSRRLFRWVW